MQYGSVLFLVSPSGLLCSLQDEALCLERSTLSMDTSEIKGFFTRCFIGPTVQTFKLHANSDAIPWPSPFDLLLLGFSVRRRSVRPALLQKLVGDFLNYCREFWREFVGFLDTQCKGSNP